MDNCVTLDGVWKIFSGRAVLKDIHLQIACGEVVVALGANGAGKTTLFRILAGIARPDRGQVVRGKKRIAYLSHEQMLYGDLTVAQHLQFWGLASDRGRDVVARFGLDVFAGRKARLLSQGYRQMLSAVQVFGHPADLYVLDEPAVALDTRAAQVLAELVAREKANGAAIVLSEHRDLAWAAPDRIVRVADQKVTDA